MLIVFNRPSLKELDDDEPKQSAKKGSAPGGGTGKKKKRSKEEVDRDKLAERTARLAAGSH